MVSKCANPPCGARLKYLHDGVLFAIPKRKVHAQTDDDVELFGSCAGGQIEWFFLCRSCSEEMTMTQNGALVAVQEDAVAA